MTLATMIYGLIVAALVGGAAWFLDRGLRALGRPTRWVWIGAIGVGGLAPLFPRLLPAAAPEGGPGSFVLPVRALYELGTPAPPLPEHSGSFLAGVGLENSLGALWILGSILVLILFALICLRLRRLRATWEPQDVCGEQVLRSEKFGPAVVGLTRSRIVLPSWTFGLGERELEMVVRHEREHVRARDPALLAAGFLLASLSPWNPAIWWSLTRLRLAVEGDCDRRVLARGTPARSYARLLLTVAAGSRRTPDPVPALIRGGHSVIERRLMMIRTATRKPRIRASILAGAVGLGLFALACDTPIPQSLDEPERLSRSEAGVVVGPEARVGLEAEVGYVDGDGRYQVIDSAGEGLYFDEDGVLQVVDPEVEVRIRRTLDRLRTTLESERARLRATDARTGEKVPVPEDLWIALGSGAESVSSRREIAEVANELAMEVRRLATKVQAGEMTRDEAGRTLRARLDSRDPPR
ncbi:M56 family metallopeptidase [Candidatus Palauibacter sp.]|uniref:M56 family metallopeptidase n=1 Tax=Candidatus Palauibacter sp. TaxID=3101350 RepID=UPI003B58CED1